MLGARYHFLGCLTGVFIGLNKSTYLKNKDLKTTMVKRFGERVVSVTNPGGVGRSNRVEVRFI